MGKTEKKSNADLILVIMALICYAGSCAGSFLGWEGDLYRTWSMVVKVPKVTEILSMLFCLAPPVLFLIQRRKNRKIISAVMYLSLCGGTWLTAVTEGFLAQTDRMELLPLALHLVLGVLFAVTATVRFFSKTQSEKKIFAAIAACAGSLVTLWNFFVSPVVETYINLQMYAFLGALLAGVLGNLFLYGALLIYQLYISEEQTEESQSEEQK